MKSISSFHDGNMGNWFMKACTPMIDESQRKGERAITFCFQCCHFTERLKQRIALLKLRTAVTKFSMKPWSRATSNCHRCGSGERNGEQTRTKVSFGRSMMRILELLRLVKRHVSGWSDILQWKIQTHRFRGYQFTLVWRHQVVSQIQVVSQ